MTLPNTDVLIVGSGPTGLTLAAELALANVDFTIVDRRPSQALAGSRASGLHARSIEVFDQRGVADRFLSEGQIAQTNGFALIRLDISDFPTRHNYGLGLWQNRIERILVDWIGALGVQVQYGREMAGFTEDNSGITVDFADGHTIRTKYLVGCDGGRSLIRKAAGIDFPGWDATISNLIAEAEVAEQPELGVHQNTFGLHAFGKENYEIRDGKIVYLDGGPLRIMVTEEHVGATTEPTLADLSAALIAVCGTDYGVHSPTWISRFTDATRQAASYRKGRVLLAGDSAHIHGPQGGQGLNTGVQDAMNLGWKLALVVKGTAPDSLLDTYHAERHPVAARVLQNTMAQVALMRTDDRTKALHPFMTELLGMEEPRRRFAGMMSGLDIHYDLGPGHPLLGRRMPDLDLTTSDGPKRVFALLHKAKPVLLNLGSSANLDIAPWLDRVSHVEAKYEGEWELPVIGTVPAPAAVLIRPDGHVAWAGTETAEGLKEALTKWFGPPA